MKIILVLSLIVLLGCGQSTTEVEKENPSEKNEMEIKKDSIPNNLVWHYEADFTEQEQVRLKKWITKVYTATENRIGAYPFPIHVYFHDAGKSREPVPWAHTRRSPTQQVHFHVDLNYDDEMFINDWTAPHEISHLSIPFVGKDNSWFSEGYASFWQYQIMYELEVLDSLEIRYKYQDKFSQHIPDFESFDIPFPQAAMTLRKKHNYPAMYWGGAYFFFLLNEKLEINNSSLREVMDQYLTDYRNTSHNIDDIILFWDDILKSSACEQLYQDFRTLPSRKFLEKYPVTNL